MFVGNVDGDVVSGIVGFCCLFGGIIGVIKSTYNVDIIVIGRGVPYCL